MSQFTPDLEDATAVRTDKKVKEPPMYKVLLHNDDYTTMEFVVQVLMFVFHRPMTEATRIMLNVHEHGIGVCGVYPYQMAETKVDTVHALAREKGFPLKCSMEKDI